MGDEGMMPTPTEEHTKLTEHAGDWKVDCTFYMPDGNEMKTEGKETVEMFGAFFTASVFESDMFGAPFKGRATLGYEPARGEYVGTWVDTFTPVTYYFRGKFDDAGRVLEMTGEGLDFMSGQPAQYRTTEEHNDDGTRTFEMFMTPTGAPEIKLFTHIYSRA